MDISYYKSLEPFWENWVIAKEKPLGEGSFGKVFEIKRTDSDEIRSALKIITISQDDSEWKGVVSSGMDANSVAGYFRGMVDDIVQEIKMMSRLKAHANIVSYEDHKVIEHKDGRGWDILIRMELLKPLMDQANENGFLPAEEVLKMGRDISKALQFCETKNILHRDIKPGNIMVSEAGDYKLGDFGVARTIQRGAREMSQKGSFPYMAPEVYKGKAYEQTVDIYSLGIVMYKLLNFNREPFWPPYPAEIRFSDTEEALTKRMNGEPLPLPANGGDALGKVILKACAYNAEDRYAEAGAFLKALQGVKVVDKEPPMRGSENENVSSFLTDRTADKTADQGKGSGEDIYYPDDNDVMTDKEIEKQGGTFRALGDFPGKKSAHEPSSAGKKEEVPTAKKSAPSVTPAPSQPMPSQPLPSLPPKKKKNALPLIIGLLAGVFVLIAVVLVVLIVNGKKQEEARQVAREVVIEEPESVIGSVVEFGSYEQDGNTDNGAEPIRWIVIDTNGSYELLLSVSILDYIPYNEIEMDVTWESCSLRDWLNNDFLNAAFNADEQNRIGNVKVVNSEKKDSEGTQGYYDSYGQKDVVSAGNDTQDRIFLLSAKEASDDGYYEAPANKMATERIIGPTAFAQQQGAYAYTKEAYDEFGADMGYPTQAIGGTAWLLRTPGDTASQVSCVMPWGSIEGYNSVADPCGVRPVLWRKAEETTEENRTE